MHSNKLAIITVNYNNYPVTEELLDSLKIQDDRNFRVYLVDVSTKRRTLSYPSYVTTLTRPNKGYSYGVNEGTKQAIRDGYSLLVEINNDTEVAKDFVSAVKKSLIHHPDSIIGPKIYYYPGYEYHPTAKKSLGKILWFAGGKIDWKNVFTKHRGVDEVDTGQYNTAQKTSFLSGCCIAYTAQAFQMIGDWDESYFMYYEDADWSMRARAKGVSCIYDPSIVIWHKNGQSTGGSGSTFHTKYQERNRFKFGLKYAPFRTKVHLVKNRLLKLLSFS